MANHRTQKACRALKSTYRWCLSGTPFVPPLLRSLSLIANSFLPLSLLLESIQNSIDDLFSLFEFLGKGVVGPYYELGVFKDKISGPLKAKKVELAMGRLRVSFSSFPLSFRICRSEVDSLLSWSFVIAGTSCCNAEEE